MTLKEGFYASNAHLMDNLKSSLYKEIEHPTQETPNIIRRIRKPRIKENTMTLKEYYKNILNEAKRMRAKNPDREAHILGKELGGRFNQDTGRWEGLSRAPEDAGKRSMLRSLQQQASRGAGEDKPKPTSTPSTEKKPIRFPHKSISRK